MPTGAQSRFSLARADGVRAFPRFCLSTKAVLSSVPLELALTARLDESQQRLRAA
jgi:hypothetical protein